MDEAKPLSSSQKPGPFAPLMRLSTVLRITGLSRSTIYRMIAEGTFPAPVKIGKRAVAWRPDGVLQWVDERPSTVTRRPDPSVRPRASRVSSCTPGAASG